MPVVVVLVLALLVGGRLIWDGATDLPLSGSPSAHTSSSVASHEERP